jgi:4-hydroxybenzoate polyprenyltransferase
VKDPSDKPPRTGIDKFLFGSDESQGLGAVWWGIGGFIAATGAIFLVLDRNWLWAIVVAALAAWEFWRTQQAIRRRNF